MVYWLDLWSEIMEAAWCRREAEKHWGDWLKNKAVMSEGSEEQRPTGGCSKTSISQSRVQKNNTRKTQV